MSWEESVIGDGDADGWYDCSKAGCTVVMLARHDVMCFADMVSRARCYI